MVVLKYKCIDTDNLRQFFGINIIFLNFEKLQRKNRYPSAFVLITIFFKHSIPHSIMNRKWSWMIIGSWMMPWIDPTQSKTKSACFNFCIFYKTNKTYYFSNILQDSQVEKKFKLLLLFGKGQILISKSTMTISKKNETKAVCIE